MLATAATGTKIQKRYTSTLKRTTPKNLMTMGRKWSNEENKQLLNFLRNKKHYVPNSKPRGDIPTIRWRMVINNPNKYSLLVARMRVNESGRAGKHLLKRVKYMKTHSLLPNNVKKVLKLL